MVVVAEEVVAEEVVAVAEDSYLQQRVREQVV